jgi:hypothetical protein
MPNLHWTFPLANWSSWPVTGGNAPDPVPPNIDFIAPMLRRRLSKLSRMAVKVAHDCASEAPTVRVVLASRHGELRRSTEIINDLVSGRPVSPAAFSLSVLNAMAGVFGIARQDRAPATAIAAGDETLGYALVEAYAQYASDASTPVLLVFVDELPDSCYGPMPEGDASPGALALLFDARAAAADMLECTVAPNDPSADPSADVTAHASAISGTPMFASQCEAMQHSLMARGAASWRNAANTWTWRCNASAS